MSQTRNPTSRSDAELILASNNDPAAFRELYDRNADALLAFLYRRVLDPEVAADLLAETFAIAYEKRGRYRDTGAPGVAWLYSIARIELSRYFPRHRVQLKTAQRLGLVVPGLCCTSRRPATRAAELRQRPARPARSRRADRPPHRGGR